MTFSSLLKNYFLKNADDCRDPLRHPTAIQNLYKNALQ